MGGSRVGFAVQKLPEGLDVLDEEAARSIDLTLSAVRPMIFTQNWDMPMMWLAEAATTNAVIYLNDALQKLSQAGLRIDTREDVEEGDLTDLIARYRNAACHIGSAHRRVRMANGHATVSFNVFLNDGPSLNIEGTRIGPFPNDVAYYYGTIRLLQGRNLVRAYQLAVRKLHKAVREAQLNVHLLTPER